MRKIINKVRIRNQYLIAILRTVSSLGAKNVSSMLLIEVWQSRGKQCDELFFLHFDTLLNYGFLKQQPTAVKALSLEELLTFSEEQDNLLSTTHEGHNFLDRYGRD